MQKRKLFRITTVPVSLDVLLKGQHRFMSKQGFEVVGVSSSGQNLEAVEKMRVLERCLLRCLVRSHLFKI